MTDVEATAPTRDSQTGYEETPYEDASWEIVGEHSETVEFEPLKFDVVPGSRAGFDPMFADYGGTLGSDVTQRWHLPEDVAYEGPISTRGLEQEEEPDDLIKMREEELEALKTQIFEEGRQAGLVAAVEENNQRLAVLEQQFGQLLPDLQRQLRERIEEIEKQAVQFALNISQKIISEAVEINPEYIIKIISEALDQAGAATVKKIRISPQDMEFIDIVGLARQFDTDNEWVWEADETVRAGCIVETSAGEIDFQIDHAWERIRENVMKIAK